LLTSAVALGRVPSSPVYSLANRVARTGHVQDRAFGQIAQVDVAGVLAGGHRVDLTALGRRHGETCPERGRWARLMPGWNSACIRARSISKVTGLTLGETLRAGVPVVEVGWIDEGGRPS